MTLSTPNAQGDSCALWFGDMQLPVSSHSSANAWPPQSVDGAEAFLDGSTPKAQPMDSAWGNLNVSSDINNTDWSLHTGLTPTGEAIWPIQQQQQQQKQLLDQRSTSPKTSRTSGPMPIPERSSTEPLWQRRLNAKNRELHQLHSRMSAPDVHVTDQMSSPIGRDVPTSNDGSNAAGGMPAWSQPTQLTTADHDFTHASPNTLHMLGIDPNSFNATASNAVQSTPRHVASDSSSFENNNVGRGDGSTTNDVDFAAQMALMQTLNAGTLPGHALSLSSSLPQHTSMGMSGYGDDLRSPRAFRHSLQDNDLRMFETADASSSTGGATYMGNGYRPSSGFASGDSTAYVSAFAPSTEMTTAIGGSDKATASSSSLGKGVINKVIVPPAHGASSDAIDLRTGEAGQMRHVCPHPGCDKHFSTSGHARRHSRIHDCLRPFECPHQGCHATFTRRDNCTQHQRARHRYQLVAHRIGDEQ